MVAAEPSRPCTRECFVDSHEAARFLKVNYRTLQRWAREGRPPAHRLNDGSHQDWRFFLSELDAWLRERITSGSRPLPASRRIQ